MTYTVGFAASNQMLDDAARVSTGIYYQANDEAELITVIQNVFADIEARTSSAASVATNSTRLASDTFIYQARFSSGDWGGQLLAYPIGLDGSIATIDGSGVPVLGEKTGWNAAHQVPAAANRNIYTYDPSSHLGMAFTWNALTSDQKGELNKNSSGVVDGLGSSRLNYLRGDTALESPAGTFRVRSSPLGDIINSDPTFVGDQNYGFRYCPAGKAPPTRLTGRVRVISIGNQWFMWPPTTACSMVSTHFPAKSLWLLCPTPLIRNSLTLVMLPTTPATGSSMTVHPGVWMLI